MRSTSSYGATDVIAPVFTITRWPGAGRLVVTPIAASRSLMIVTSAMSGTLVMWCSPSANSVAAISFSTEFFAPGTTTSPRSGPDWPTTITASELRRSGALPSPG